MSPDSLGVPSRKEAREMVDRRAKWEATSPEGRQTYSERIDQETATRNLQIQAEYQIKAREYRNKWVSRKATTTIDITVQDGADVITLAKQGEHVDIVDADLGRHIFNDVKIRTLNNGEGWVDSMCLELQE
jgi:hypothetical protein